MGRGSCPKEGCKTRGNHVRNREREGPGCSCGKELGLLFAEAENVRINEKSDMYDAHVHAFRQV